MLVRVLHFEKKEKQSTMLHLIISISVSRVPCWLGQKLTAASLFIPPRRPLVPSSQLFGPSSLCGATRNLKFPWSRGLERQHHQHMHIPAASEGGGYIVWSMFFAGLACTCICRVCCILKGDLNLRLRKYNRNIRGFVKVEVTPHQRK